MFHPPANNLSKTQLPGIDQPLSSLMGATAEAPGAQQRPGLTAADAAGAAATHCAAEHHSGPLHGVLLPIELNHFADVDADVLVSFGLVVSSHGHFSTGALQPSISETQDWFYR